MRIVTLAMVGGLVLAGTSPSFAQDADGDDTEAPATDGATDGEEAAAGDDSKAAGGSGQSYSTEEGSFPVRRGLFVEADLGMFMSFGGRNTNDPNATFPSKGVSNMQPAVGMFVGYDVFSNDSMNFAAGLKGGLLANGGAGQVSSADLANTAAADVGTRSNDFEMWELGLSGVGDFYLTDRIALTGKIGGGLIIYNPSPFEAANQVGGDPEDALLFPDAGKAAFGGYASVSIGAIINTRLPGFTFGIHNRLMMFFGGKFFLGIAPEFALKYNF